MVPVAILMGTSTTSGVRFVICETASPPGSSRRCRMDFSRICAITFGDVAGAFVVGMMVGAALLWLVALIMKDRPDE